MTTSPEIRGLSDISEIWEIREIRADSEVICFVIDSDMTRVISGTV